MKIIRCKNCKSWHSVIKTSLCTCWCGRSYFRIQEIGSEKIYVHGPCTVWTVPDKQFLTTHTKKPQPGMIVQMQWMKEPHKNVERITLDRMLFLDQFDPHARKRGLARAENKTF